MRIFNTTKQLAQWAWSYYSYHFAGDNYERFRCRESRKVSMGVLLVCERMRHHPGRCSLTPLTTRRLRSMIVTKP